MKQTILTADSVESLFRLRYETYGKKLSLSVDRGQLELHIHLDAQGDGFFAHALAAPVLLFTKASKNCVNGMMF